MQAVFWRAAEDITNQQNHHIKMLQNNLGKAHWEMQSIIRLVPELEGADSLHFRTTGTHCSCQLSVFNNSNTDDDVIVWFVQKRSDQNHIFHSGGLLLFSSPANVI